MATTKKPKQFAIFGVYRFPYNYDVSHYINYSELKSAYRKSRKRKTA